MLSLDKDAFTAIISCKVINGTQTLGYTKKYTCLTPVRFSVVEGFL